MKDDEKTRAPLDKQDSTLRDMVGKGMESDTTWAEEESELTKREEVTPASVAHLSLTYPSTFGYGITQWTSML